MPKSLRKNFIVLSLKNAFNRSDVKEHTQCNQGHDTQWLIYTHNIIYIHNIIHIHSIIKVIYDPYS